MRAESEAIALFGTAEPRPERRILRAGALSAVHEEGNLRTIRYGGVEVVRAVNYLARDTSWGTYKAELSNIAVDKGEDASPSPTMGSARTPKAASPIA